MAAHDVSWETEFEKSGSSLLLLLLLQGVFFYVWIEKWRLSPSLTETATAGYAVSAVAGSSAPAVLRY